MNATILFFRKEILCFIRDKNILIYSIVFPIFLYPLTFWIMNQVMLLQRGAVEESHIRILIENSNYFPELQAILSTGDHVLVLTSPSDRTDEIHATVRIDDYFRGARHREYSCIVRYDDTDEYSQHAHELILAALEEAREFLIQETVSSGQEMIPIFIIEEVSIDSGEQIGAFIIGKILPMMIIIMAAMGTFYPAIDVLSGERERRTIETTLLSPVSRTSIIVGKFGAVVVAGVIAVFLNIGSLALTAQHTLFLLEDEGAAVFMLPYETIPLILLSSIIISACFGAASILIASYAKTFREAQSYVTPFFVLSFQPAIIAALPGIELTPTLAFVPVANIALMFRDIILEQYDWAMISLVLFSFFFYTIIILFIASRRLQNENTLWGEKSETTHLKSEHWMKRFFSRSVS